MKAEALNLEIREKFVSLLEMNVGSNLYVHNKNVLCPRVRIRTLDLAYY